MKYQMIQGSWSTIWINASSNLGDLAAVWEALKELGPTLWGKDICILSDNVTTVSYLNKQGGTSNRNLTLQQEFFYGQKRTSPCLQFN